MNTTRDLVKTYVTQGMPGHQEFRNFLYSVFDIETYTNYTKAIQDIVNAGDRVKQKLKQLHRLIRHLHKMESRKEQARTIRETYHPINSEFVPVAFALLDKKELTKQQIEKLVQNQLYLDTFF